MATGTAPHKLRTHITLSRATFAFAFLTLAGHACAQSSVTLFGVVDSAVRSASTSGVGRVNGLVSGAYSSSRFGFRGQEDLGGGLAASFWLESFLNVDAGTTTPAGFQRRSTVSLSDRTWGELRLGRDYTPTHSNWARFDPFGYVGLGAVQLFALSAAGNTPVTAAFGAAPNTVQRASNGVQYLLPRNAWGVEGGITTTFAENGTAANDQHKSNGGRLGITLGPVFVSAATFKTQNDRTIGAFKDSAFAASWNASFVRLSAGVRRFEYQNATQNNYLLGAVFPVGVQEFKVSWNRADFGGRVGNVSIEDNRADQLALGYVYHLSRRTHLFSTVSSIRNKGNSRFVVPGAPAGTAGAKSHGIELGINHEF